MFNGFFAEGAHLVEEKCGPYKHTTSGDRCKYYKNCSPVAKVERSFFIETSPTEHAVNELKIQKEILRNGPVVGEFKAPNKFKYYDAGILSEDDYNKPSTARNVQIEDQTLVQIAEQNLDHSVMLLGWGVDPKSQTKVWIARNSFGANWGEKGDFYIRRGQNDFGIESEVSAYEVVHM